MNVLFVTADQWRGDCLGYAGHPVVRTPHMDALAARGTAFVNHHSACAPCSPARASIYTGLYQWNHRVVGNGAPLDDRFDTLARAARRAGHRPTLFGYTDTGLDPRGRHPRDPALTSYEEVLPGFEVAAPLREDDRPWAAWLAAKGRTLPDPYHAVAADPGETISRAPPAYGADETQTAYLTGRFLDWLDTRAGPFFAHLSYLRPHPPFVVPEPYAAMYDPETVPPPIPGGDHPLVAMMRDMAPADAFQPGAPGRVADLTERDLRRLRAIYYGMVTEVDAQIGRLMQGLAARGILDDTLVVVTSDHGEMLGDHGLLGKGGFYPQSQHVPLVLAGPGVAPGRVDAFTSATDLFPTLCEILGVAPTHAPDGMSLVPWLRRETPAWREAALWEFDFRLHLPPDRRRAMGLGPRDCAMLARRSATHLYGQFRAAPPVLFDLAADPDCRTDIAGMDPTARLACAEALIRERMGLNDETLAQTVLTDRGPIPLA